MEVNDFDEYYPVDWTKYMNPVVDNNRCPACWAFATAASIEGRYSIKYGTKIKLSEQQMIDCCLTTYGCNGGLYTRALYYILSVEGLMK